MTTGFKTLGRAIAAATLAATLLKGMPAPKTKATTVTRKTATAAQSSAGPQIDLNSATRAQLSTLPGVGPATVKKIIAGRPYTAVSDLSRVGVTAATIRQITPLVKVGGPQAAAATSPTKPSPAAVPAQQKQTEDSNIAPGGGPGMVWVNQETKIFHKQGDPWYGKTKKGHYMTEAEALKAGYHPAKQAKESQP